MAIAAQASAKALMPNQHLPLHFIYGREGCCFCGKEEELQMALGRITQLELQVLRLESKALTLPKLFRPLAESQQPRNRRERRREASEESPPRHYGIRGKTEVHPLQG